MIVLCTEIDWNDTSVDTVSAMAKSLQIFHAAVADRSVFDRGVIVYCMQQQHCESAMYSLDAAAEAADQPTGLYHCQ